MSEKIINPEEYNETTRSLHQWLEKIKYERIHLYEQISHHIKPETYAVEIGAGSSWLTSLCSQHKNIKHIYAIDIDKRRLDLAQKFFSKKLNANMSKLLFHISDFHNLNFIKTSSIDIIFVDGALHHTDTLNLLLKELYRILKYDGKIIAIREPILPKLPILKQYKKSIFGKEQIKQGDIENIYSKDEWISFLNSCNFNIKFYPLYSNNLEDKILKSIILKKMNGIIFNRYYIIAKKQCYNVNI